MISRVTEFYRKLAARAVLFTAGTLLAILLFISSLVAFLTIAKYVFLENKQEFDMLAFKFLDSIITDRTTQFMLVFTALGNYQVLIVANILLILYFLFVRRHKWYSIKIPAIALGGIMILSLLKIWFNRPRPLIPLLEPARGLSFPSGHAMCSVTFFGLLIYFVSKTDSPRTTKIFTISCLVFLILIIGVSRVYLKVHYASDVLAGFSAGIIWLILSIWILRKIELYSKRKLNKVLEQNSSDQHLG